MTTMQKRHSFIVCAYKESPSLRDCILSLKNQTVPSMIKIATSTPNEYIEKTAAEFGLDVLINKKCGGIAEDWNFALSQCETPYCTLAHQDDVYEPEFTEKSLQVMTDSTLIVFSDYFELRGTEKNDQTFNLKIKKILLRGLRDRRNAGKRACKRRALSFGNAICCPAVTYNMERIPNELFVSGMRSNIDWQAWELLSRTDGEFQYIPVPLMAHRIHEQSETSKTIEENKRAAEDLEVFRLFWPAPVASLISSFYTLSEKSNKQ